MDWQTIDSAPLDGTQIMMASRYHDVCICAFNIHRGEWRIQADGMDAIAYMGDFGTEYKTFGVPEFWAPVPTPPDFPPIWEPSREQAGPQLG